MINRRLCCRCRTIDRRQVWKTPTEAQEARTEDHLPKARHQPPRRDRHVRQQRHDPRAGGNDIICAGAGSDHVHGGAGNDKIFGGGGNDTEQGGDGSDTLVGGSDTLVGGRALTTCRAATAPTSWWVTADAR